MQSSPQASSVHMQHLQSTTVAFLNSYVELCCLENRNADFNALLNYFFNQTTERSHATQNNRPMYIYL